ncbi:MAG: AAA family ATPase [Asgard group archaeon]|nr:AAA family ATPase [Asgard group archaeon]
MIYWNDDSFLLATGLPLDCIADILTKSSNIDEIESNLMNYGQKYLRRYQVVKEYYNLSKQGKQRLPIIPLIIGMPGIGKTALAKELSTALNIGIVIGGDSLRTTIRQHISRKKNEIFFTSVYDTWKFFGEKSTKTIIEGYKSQAKVMNTTIERMIADRGFRDGESMIIEYLHFLPSQFDEEVIAHPSLMPIILKITDKEIYERRIKDRTFYSHLRNSGERLLSQIDIYLEMQDYLCEEAKHFDLQIISINNFEKGFELALNYLTERIANLNKIKDYKKDLRLVKEIIKERKND